MGLAIMILLLDHGTDDFSNELLIGSKNTILEVLGRE